MNLNDSWVLVWLVKGSVFVWLLKVMLLSLLFSWGSILMVMLVGSVDMNGRVRCRVVSLCWCCMGWLLKRMWFLVSLML